jgi:chaperone required for assembly of F1-ATPase
LNAPLRRFYKEVALLPVAGGFQPALDGRPLLTPAKAALTLPNLPFAEAVAEEWRSQGERIRPASMPLTQLANTAIDRVTPDPGATLDELLGYAGTDLVCYRAEAPATLVERQQRLWQPLLDDLARRHDVLLNVHAGIIPHPQPDAALSALRRHLSSLPPFVLTGLAALTRSCGSLVIALALAEGLLTPEEAFDLSQLDEGYQIEQWGEDREAAERRRALRQEILETHRFLGFAR